MTVTVLAVADQVSPLLYDHFQPGRWKNVDLILSCGDLPPSYLDFLCSSLDVPILFVRGNHDHYPEEEYAGCRNIHGKIVECKGLRIAGFEGCRRYNGGAHQFTERQMSRWVRRLQLQALWAGPPDIVLVHAPPAGCHDSGDTCHKGFTSFCRAIDIWKPAFFIHGHTHAYECRENVTEVGRTTVVNAYPYHVFQIQTGTHPRFQPHPPARQTSSPAGESRPGCYDTPDRR